MADVSLPGPTRIGRVVIGAVRPTTPDGVSAAKAVAGRPVAVSADVYADGHDVLAARVCWRAADDSHPGSQDWQTAPLAEVGNDRWEGRWVPAAVGPHEFVIEGWVNLWSTWAHRVVVKAGAGQDVAAELEEGALILDALGPGRDDAKGALRSGDPSPAYEVGLAAELSAMPLGVVTTSRVQRVWVDRERAAVGAWYELFPRSYGGLKGTKERLAAVAAMGFDVVYLAPIHPIGTTARKGPGNSLVAGPGDPGSPWAIGSADGGHDAVHLELGTLDDFEALVAEGRRLGLEVALDLAWQCSPDHPWVRTHPEWFTHRADGSIRYAENPPKRYQDIYPIDFLPPDEGDRQALWEACRDVVEHWLRHGVRIFRVDNPHTKPFAFWEWLLDDVRRRHPDVVWLAEAFTRPRIMERLAEIGFSQSYTYFTWRTTRDELAGYAEELAHGPASDYFRPNLWPNTPDILSGPLRRGGPGAFKMRAALAATLGPSWGVYSGYELCENEPASEINEEYAHSEKYEIPGREWDAPGSIAPYLSLLNAIRGRHEALADLRSLHVHGSTDGALLVFSKQCPGDTVLVVVNVDPAEVREGLLQLDLEALGWPWEAELTATDEVTGATWPWRGPNPYVRLTPDEPAHIFDLQVR